MLNRAIVLPRFAWLCLACTILVEQLKPFNTIRDGVTNDRTVCQAIALDWANLTPH